MRVRLTQAETHKILPDFTSCSTLLCIKKIPFHRDNARLGLPEAMLCLSFFSPLLSLQNMRYEVSSDSMHFNSNNQHAGNPKHLGGGERL